MKIAIAGTRGIPARYGGFETFAEELARRDASAVAPLDRDPVPGRYAELVSRYYQSLGQGGPVQKTANAPTPAPGPKAALE